MPDHDSSSALCPPDVHRSTDPSHSLDQAARVAIIIVNYGTAELTIASVQSVLARDTSRCKIEIHVVDNASPDGDAETLATAHSEHGWGARVTLWPEGKNGGFGAGNNVVLRALLARDNPPEYAFLLNPDAHLENDAPEILANALDADDKAGFAGASLSQPTGEPLAGAFRFPRPIGEFQRQLAFGPVVRRFPKLVTPLPSDHPEGTVDWVSGAAVMIRLATLRDIGVFDTGYFLYYEEVDLMHRGARANWHTVFVPQAKVVHVGGAATNIRSGTQKAPRKPAYWYRSWGKYFGDNYGLKGLTLAATAWTLGAVGNHLLGLVPGRTVSVPQRFYGDIWAFAWRPLLGLKEGTRD